MTKIEVKTNTSTFIKTVFVAFHSWCCTHDKYLTRLGCLLLGNLTFTALLNLELYVLIQMYVYLLSKHMIVTLTSVFLRHYNYKWNFEGNQIYLTSRMQEWNFCFIARKLSLCNSLFNRAFNKIWNRWLPWYSTCCRVTWAWWPWLAHSELYPATHNRIPAGASAGAISLIKSNALTYDITPDLHVTIMWVKEIITN